MRSMCALVLALATAAAAKSLGGLAWTLLEDSESAVRQAVTEGAGFGVTEVQLSHDIIMDIDDVFDDTRRDRVNLYIDIAHSANMTAVVWTHEFNNVGGASVCFEPSDPVWDARREAYRQGLARIPNVDGVVLMFGSASLEPWYALCRCSFCTDNTTVPEPLRPLLIPSPPERVEALVRLVHGVVVEEFGLKLIIRTFTHRPVEIEHLREAFMRLTDLNDIILMSKDVPQDFEPYYPRDPLIGEFPWLRHIVECDAAGEYWGRSVLPFAAPAYWERRFAEFPVKLDGYTARVSRGSDCALGTPNEVNLLTLQRLFENDTVLAEAVMDEFVAYMYPGLTEDTTPLVARALALTQDIGRKMYYFLGFWALEKGSGLPDRLRGTPLLIPRSISHYDPDYGSVFHELREPTEQTLIALRQEKLEALELSVLAQSLIDQAAAMAPEANLTNLATQLLLQETCTRVWTEIAECVWGYRLWEQTMNETALGWVDFSLQHLLELADLVDQRHALDAQWPCEADSVRKLVADMRRHVPEGGGSPREQLFIFPPTLTVDADGRSATVEIRLPAPAHVVVEYGEKAPTYGESVVSAEAAWEHLLVLPDLTPGRWYALRILALTAAGGQVQTRGSDYWFNARPSFSLIGWR